MEIREAFELLNSRIIPSDAMLSKAKEHCDYIKRIFDNDSILRPIKFYYSGSYAKNTTISPLKDVDLVPHYDLEMCLKPNGDFYKPGNILGKFYQRLQQTFGTRITVRRQRRSIGIRFIDFDVELVPVFWDGNKEYKSYIPDREKDEWIITSIPMHLEFLSKRDSYNRLYAKTIRLIKVWKKHKAIPRSLKGFALELLVVKALDTSGTSTHFGENFFSVMDYVTNNRFEEIIWFDDYMSASQVASKQTPVMVIDPVNPTNNITYDISSREKDQILGKFDNAYQQARWALEAEERGNIPNARRRWRAIFGSGFPLR